MCLNILVKNLLELTLINSLIHLIDSKQLLTPLRLVRHNNKVYDYLLMHHLLLGMLLVRHVLYHVFDNSYRDSF